MKAVVCDGHALRLERDRPEPTPGPGEVLLDVRLAGICDTDLQLARGYMAFRGVAGHEFVATDPAGRRVTAEINASCHRCATCRAGRDHHCPHRTVLGIAGRDGAMADQVVVPARSLHATPDAIDDRRAVFIEPLAAAFRILEQVDVGDATRAAVVGDGKLGLLCAWVLRSAGAQVVLVGKHPEKLALAGPGVEPSTLVEAGRRPRTFDLVVEATGSPTGLPTALGLVRPMGTIVLKTTVAGPHEIALAPAVVDEVRIVGSRCGPFPPAIAALQQADGFPVERLIDGIYPLDRFDEALAAAARPGARKVLLEINPTASS